MMRTFGHRIVLGQLDLVRAFHVIDRTDMHTVGAENFHVLANLAGVEHVFLHLVAGTTDGPGMKFRPQLRGSA
jgi:hypothetical protein